MSVQVADTGLSSEAERARQAFVYQVPSIRGICVLAVIVIHITAPATSAITHVDPLTVVVSLANSLTRFAVPLFVLLSGFHLSLNVRNERALPFYRRSLKLLVIPYVVYSTLYLLPAHPGTDGLLKDWLLALLLGSAHGHLWFIPLILELYLLHPFLRRWYRRAESVRSILAVALGVQLAASIFTALMAQWYPNNTWLALAFMPVRFLNYVWYFMAGYYVLDHAGAIASAIRRPAVARAAGIVWLGTAAIITRFRVQELSGASAAPQVVFPHVVCPILTVLMVLAALVVLMIWRPEKHLAKPAKWLVQGCGLYAYGTYFLHPIAVLAVGWGVRHLATPALAFGGVAYYASACLIVPVSSVLAVKTLTRLPFTRYLA